jgi:hypothetical protein
VLRSVSFRIAGHLYGREFYIVKHNSGTFNNKTVYYIIINAYLNARVGRSGKLLLVLASTVILGSESRETHDRILLSRESRCHAIVF